LVRSLPCPKSPGKQGCEEKISRGRRPLVASPDTPITCALPKVRRFPHSAPLSADRQRPLSRRAVPLPAATINPAGRRRPGAAGRLGGKVR
jgi:hypothetical protein